MNKILPALTLLLSCMLPNFVLAQGQCSEDDQDSLDICIEDATYDCLEAFPACEEGSSDSDSAAQVVIDNITESCCSKGNSGKIVACLNAASASLKKGGKIMPSDMRNAIKSELKVLLSDVRENGECDSDDDEDEDEDDDE